MIKLFHYDLETTGTKFWKNGIHQISGLIEIDNEIKEEFNFSVCPNPDSEISQEALDIGGVTLEQIKEYPSMKGVHIKLTEMLSKYVDKYDKTDKFHLIGYNISSFDNQFLRAFFTQNGDNYFGSFFWSDSIDVMSKASDKLKDVRAEMLNFKLKTVARQLRINVDEEKLHDAMYDIKLTKEVYETLNK